LTVLPGLAEPDARIRPPVCEMQGIFAKRRLAGTGPSACRQNVLHLLSSLGAWMTGAVHVESAHGLGNVLRHFVFCVLCSVFCVLRQAPGGACR
jgi:hypothetical protein